MTDPYWSNRTKMKGSKGTRVGVVGIRRFYDYEAMKEVLDGEEISLIVSGGAKGTDTLAERYAKEYNIPFIVHLPKWDKYGRAAGPIRNKLIVRDSDRIIAFWDGQSRGTKSTIELAEKAGKPVNIQLIVTPL